MTENTEKIIILIINKLENDEFSHLQKIQLFALFFEYLNAGSITYVADRIGISYNAVKNNRQVLKLGGLKIAIPRESDLLTTPNHFF
ncbi:MAG: hypothetical protein R3279_07500 [Putridiphycobacter sp.]|nr:hypothetical protein [Putridiphycobacter sp.]